MLRNQTIQEMLRGLEPARAQTVGNMTVIPLASDIVDEGIVPPDALELATTGYGTVVAFNTGTPEGTGLTISPLGNLVMTGKRAQNHVVPDMRLVKQGRRVVMKNAACVQERQGGLIRRGRYRLMLLPAALREDALDSRRVRSYDKLWAPIRAFNRGLGLRKAGHLEYFMDRFAREMDAFVAQFEIVPRQVGAIVLIGGEVVGLERFPNYRYFKTMWEPLIRECYGSMSIQAGVGAVPKNRVPLDAGGVTDLAGIRSALLRARSREADETTRIVNGFIRTGFAVKREEKAAGLVVETLTNPQFKGQRVRRGRVPLMFSFVKTRAWRTDANHRRWAAAGPFRMPDFMY